MPEVFNPKPAEDYPTLLKQFNSLVRLHRNGQIHTSTLQREVEALMSQLAQTSPAEVESQRDANAEMTTLLEQQEIELARLRTLTHNQKVELDALRQEVLFKPGTGQTDYRAAADIYYQLATECQIPQGGSLVVFVNQLQEAAQILFDIERGQRGGITKNMAMSMLEEALDASYQTKGVNHG